MDLGRVLLAYLLSVLILFSFGCSKAKKSAQSLSSSEQQDKAASPSGQPPENAPQDDKAISYAKDPDRFVKMPTVEPPFTITNPKTATEFFDVGVHEDNLHHYDKAIAAYEQGLKLKPDWALLALREAKDYRRLGQRDQAIAQFQRATTIDSHYWDAYAELAQTYEAAGDTTHAIEAASKMLAFPALRIPVHNQLGYWFEELDNKREAKHQFEIYRELAAKSKREPETERYQAAMHELQKLSK